MRTPLLLVLLWLSAIALGCTGGGHSATSPSDHSQFAPEPQIWGAFEINTDAAGQPVIAAISEHSAQVVVNPYVQVDLLSTEYDPVTRIWDIDARFTNLTNYTGFGLWVVFHNLNANQILDQDGFATQEKGGDFPNAPGFGQRKPVVAIGKDQERRRFIGGASLEGHIRIQWPAGATNFSGLRFYLDASFPYARQEPIVENLTFGSHENKTTIAAMVIDWQQNAEPLNVRANFRVGQQPSSVPMNDSGEGADQVAGDNIFTGTALSETNLDETVVVFVRDSGNNHFENELGLLGQIAPVPCPSNTTPGAFRPFLDGQQSLIHTAQQRVANNANSWGLLWSQHAPNTQPPPVNFECYNVYAVFMGERPTGGYGVMPTLMMPAGLLPELCYSTFSPGGTCEKPAGLTAPYRMWLGPKFGDVAWRGSERLRECGMGNVPFQTLFKGNTSASQKPALERLIQQPGDLAYVWDAYGLPGQVPCIDFMTESVLFVSKGTVEREGHGAMFTAVNSDPAPAPGTPLGHISARWDAISPGEGCQTESRINTPVHVGVVPHVPEVEFIRTNRNAEPCSPTGGECQPKSLLIQEVPNFKEGSYKQLITNPGSFEEFWNQAFPNVPRPTISFEQQSVIAIGVTDHSRRIDIECVRQIATSEGPRLQVTYDVTSPGANCPPFVNRHYVVAAIGRFTGGVDWIGREFTAAPCQVEPECGPYETIVNRQESYKGGANREVMNTRDSWELFWSQAYPNEPPAPQLNFENLTVIAISPGQVSMSPHNMRIDCITRGEVLRVEYTRTFPGANCGTPGVHQPLLVVAVPKWTGQVAYVEKITTAPPCEPPPVECASMRVLTDSTQTEQFEQSTRVIRTLGAWEEYWNARYPGKTRPAVNFEQEMVIAINIGILNVTRQARIDCVRYGVAGTNDPIRVDWHREIINLECPFGEGNWSMVVAVARSERDVIFNEGEDRIFQCQ